MRRTFKHLCSHRNVYLGDSEQSASPLIIPSALMHRLIAHSQVPLLPIFHQCRNVSYLLLMSCDCVVLVVWIFHIDAR